MTRLRAWAAMLTWLALLGAGLAYLHALRPPVATGGDGSTYVIEVVRHLALALGWYLAASTVLSLCAHLSRAARAVTLTEKLCLAPVHRLARAAAGGLLAASSLMPAVATAEPPPPPPVMTWVGEASQPTDQQTAAPRPLAATSQEREVVVAPGDHLWSLAERRLAETLGRAPTDAEVAPYWRSVVRRNAESGRLRDSSLPDLIFPRDLILLPAPDSEK